MFRSIALTMAMAVAVSAPRAGLAGGHSSGASHTSYRSSPHSTSTHLSSHPGTEPTKASPKHSTKRVGDVPRDHHGKIKRDPEQRRAFMHSHACPSTGKTSGACPGYVVDHVVPLKRGGADHPSNMQWQTTAQAKAKDRWE